MLEQEEVEPEPVGDDASFETQGRHLSILSSYILDQLSICVLFAHELPYIIYMY